MTNNHEIPDDITPEKFFTEYIPSRFDTGKSSAGGDTLPLKAAVSFELVGQGGGTWTLLAQEDALSVVPGEIPDRIVKIVQSVDDWRSAVRGEKGFKLDLPRKDTDNRSRVTMTNEKMERLKAIEGAIKFQISDAEKGDWEITAVFGPKTSPEPDCTISMSASDAEAIRTGQLNPQTAFMSGKINIQGDIGLAMKIGTALMT